MAATQPVERADIEAKLREIRGDLAETARVGAPVMIAAGVLVVAGLVGVAFLAGRRRGRKRSTVVEIRRT
jgi:hypothetical protein